MRQKKERFTVSEEGKQKEGNWKEEKKKSMLQRLGSVSFSLLLLLGIIVCAICNMAISGSLTWSLYPISAIIFAWLIFFPVINLKKRGILCSLAVVSICIFPYLYILSRLIKDSEFMIPIGFRVSCVSVIFLWVIYALFKVFHARKQMAAVCTLLLAIPVYIIINTIISNILSEPWFDLWDLLGIVCLLFGAAVFLGIDYIKQKKQ